MISNPWARNQIRQLTATEASMLIERFQRKHLFVQDCPTEQHHQWNHRPGSPIARTVPSWRVLLAKL